MKPKRLFGGFKEYKIPYRVSYYAIKHFQEETKKAIEDTNADINLMEVLMWHSMEAGYKAEGKRNPFKRSQAEMIMDACIDQFIGEFESFFLENQLVARMKPAKEETPLPAK